MDTPYDVIDLDVVGSTQDEARRRARDGVPVVVSARRQEAGRGRRGRRWVSADEAVAASIGLRFDWPPLDMPKLALVAGLAAREVLRPFRSDVTLKWPNDLLTPAGKVGGVLCEVTDDLVVVGLGLNLRWESAPAGSAELFDADAPESIRKALVEAFASALLRRMSAGPERWGRAEYRAACSTVGSRIRWEPSGRGRAIDVDAQGALVVATDTGTVRLRAGEVWHVRDGD